MLGFTKGTAVGNEPPPHQPVVEDQKENPVRVGWFRRT